VLILLNSLSNQEFREAVVLFLRELNSSQKNTVRRIWKVSENYDNRDSKFMLKNILFDIFWQIPEAVEDGFNEFLNQKIKEYHNMWQYHKVNCPVLENKPCAVCKERIKIIDYLED
tara:strand:+ start:320 stop:667 length:348 start_codon:yes stop_codon:yes gene_type:complete